MKTLDEVWTEKFGDDCLRAAAKELAHFASNGHLKDGVVRDFEACLDQEGYPGQYTGTLSENFIKDRIVYLFSENRLGGF
jgi:hypothetical protein